jgi:hypothetical protein
MRERTHAKKRAKAGERACGSVWLTSSGQPAQLTVGTAPSRSHISIIVSDAAMKGTMPTPWQ